MNDTVGKLDWSQVKDKDIPKERAFARPLKKRKEYFYIPSTECVGVANRLGRNCLAVYALLTTAQAMRPKERWHKLPSRQLNALDLDRFQVLRAVKKLEAAGIVETKNRPGNPEAV